MAVNYTSEHTGAKIDEGVRKALNPDSKVTEDSASLVTSGAVHDALFNPTATEAAAILKALGVNVSAEVLNYLSGLSGSLTDLLDKKVDNTDIIDVPHGGTGQKTLTADSFLAGNGTGAVKLLTPTEVLTKIGAAKSDHSHSYLPLSGGTMTGDEVFNYGTAIAFKQILNDDTAYDAVSVDNNYLLIGDGGFKNTKGVTSLRGSLVQLIAKSQLEMVPYAGAYGYFTVGSTDANDGCTIRPAADSGGSIGSVSYRMKHVYSVNGVSTSSDARLKKNISDDFSKLAGVFSKLRPVIFEYADIKDEILRVGFIAQEVETAFSECGLDPDKYALLQKDELDPESEIAKFIGDTTVYSLNYDEFSPWTIAMLQKQQEEINTLKSTVEKLVETVGGEAVWQ